MSSDNTDRVMQDLARRLDRLTDNIGFDVHVHGGRGLGVTPEQLSNEQEQPSAGLVPVPAPADLPAEPDPEPAVERLRHIDLGPLPPRP